VQRVPESEVQNKGGFFGVFMHSLCILDTNPLSDMSFASVFSYSVGCLFALLMVSFAMQNLFILM